MPSPIPLTLLSRQLALLGPRFARKYPHPWLVWEPTGKERPADAARTDAAATQVPEGSLRVPRASADALCFPIGPERQVTVGRARTNEIAIDDMTISREHCLLFLEGDVWHLALKEPVTCATFVRRMSVQAGRPAFLVDGCSIRAGDVELTFYEGASLVQRLEAELKKT